MTRCGFALLACSVLLVGCEKPTENTDKKNGPGSPDLAALQKENELLRQQNELLKVNKDNEKVAGDEKPVGEKPDAAKKNGQKYRVRDIDFELLSSKVEAEYWCLEISAVSGKLKPYQISFNEVECTTEDGDRFKTRLRLAGFSRTLNTDVKTKLKVEIGTLPAKFKAFKRVELTLNPEHGNKPLVFNDVLVER